MTNTFESWMAAVDFQVEALAGVSVHDLADAPFADMFEDGLSPKAAARRAIRLDRGGEE